MKKVLKVSLGIILAVALLCTSALALSSRTWLITADANAPVQNLPEGTPALTVDGFTVIWLGDIAGSDGDTIIFTILNYLGPVRIYHYSATKGAWELIKEGEGSPITVVPDEWSPFAVAIKSAKGSGESPKTGEALVPYAAIGVAMVAAAAAVVIRRKKED